MKLMRNVLRFKAASEAFILFRSPQSMHYVFVAKVHSVNTSTSFDSVAPDV